MCAGACLLVLPDGENRRMIALYVAARATESTYRSLKDHGLWSFPGAAWQHNDALLFALSSAQVHSPMLEIPPICCLIHPRTLPYLLRNKASTMLGVT